MTRRRKTHRPPEFGPPEPSRHAAAGTVDRTISGGMPDLRRPYSRLAVCGLLLLAVIVVYGQTARHDFVNFDDDDYVYENPHVRAGLTGEGIAWAVNAYDAFNWHPLTWLSHELDCQLYGLKPAGHHLTTLLLHSAAAVLLFSALRRMTAALWPSAWVAAVFAVHPLRVESVAWVAERKDVLSGLLFMLTIWFYARYTERPKSGGRYLLVMGSLALGLAAKPMLVTLPFVLLLLDYWPLGRAGSKEQGAGSEEQGAGKNVGHGLADRGPKDGRFQIPDFGSQVSGSCALRPAPRPAARIPRLLSLVAEKIPLFVLAAISCLVTFAVHFDVMRSLEQQAFSWRVANAVVAYVAYLGQMLYPGRLAVVYPLPKDPPPAWEVIAAVGVLLAISAAVFAARRKCPCLLFGWLWYLGTLVPVIGLVQVGEQAMADRYTYLTQIGLYTAIAWGAARVAGGRPSWHRGIAAVSAAVLAALMACAWQQTSYWQNSERLWTRALACTSNNAIAHTDLGLALAGRGHFDKAIEQYHQALDINPDNIRALNDLGLALVSRGQVTEAIAHYRRALEIKPDYMQAHSDLGIALIRCGQVDKAIDHFRTALEIEPDCVDAHYNLGLALAGRGQVDEAIDHFRKAVALKPDFAEAHNDLGLALAGRGQVDEAIDHFRKAVELKPDYMLAHVNLGGALAGRGQADEAIDHFRKALEIEPDYVNAHVMLGDVLADRGRLDDALEHYQKALGLATARSDRALAEVIRARIRVHRPVAPAGKAP